MHGRTPSLCAVHARCGHVLHARQKAVHASCTKESNHEPGAENRLSLAPGDLSFGTEAHGTGRDRRRDEVARYVIQIGPFDSVLAQANARDWLGSKKADQL